jgi:putative transposase
MQKYISLEPNSYYHIFNKGINGENIFKEERNYFLFLRLYYKYLIPVVDTFSWCLLKNHFHFLIRVKEDTTPLMVSRQFSHFFNSYSQSINKAYQRTGGLFQSPFKRKLVEDERYFTSLIYYIHNNPVNHGFVRNIMDYRFSSVHQILSGRESFIMKDEVMEWFGGISDFLNFHASPAVIEDISNITME